MTYNARMTSHQPRTRPRENGRHFVFWASSWCVLLVFNFRLVAMDTTASPSNATDDVMTSHTNVTMLIFNDTYVTTEIMTSLSDTAPSMTSDPVKPVYSTICPPSCGCYKQISSISRVLQKTLDCRDVGLTSLPSNISSDIQAILISGNHILSPDLSPLSDLVNLTEVELSHNGLYSIEELDLRIASLRYLAIERNQLDYIYDRNFAGMPNLRTLSIAFNKIEILHNDAFYELKHLERLNMSHNRFFAVDAIWFRDLSTLKTLDMRSNNIHVLRDEDFKHLINLRHLILSDNRINHIYKDAFHGLDLLSHLHIDKNHLKKFPKVQSQRFRQLHLLDVSQNHFERFPENSISNINVSHLRINAQKSLKLIERYASSNMPHLVTLEMTHNPALTFIDAHAFVELPRLRRLFLQHNNLSLLQAEVLESVPGLGELDLSDNPFHCDCNINWLIPHLQRGDLNVTFMGNNQTLRCHQPEERRGVALQSLDAFPTQCAPRVIPLFSEQFNTVLGEQLRFDCRAAGIPEPQIDWFLPDHKGHDDVTVLKAGTSQNAREHILLESQGSLYIDYVQGNDHGQYACVASNPLGRDQLTTTLHVKNMGANVIVLGITSSTITVTWRNTRYTHDYQLLYKHMTYNSTYHTVDIKPFMRSFTASQLLASSKYDFCIAVKHNGNSVKINCTMLYTRQSDYLSKAIFNARTTVITTATVCFAFLMTSVACITCLAKRYNKKKRSQDDLYGDNLSQLFLASMDSMSDMTPITYENRGAEMFDDDDIEEIRSAAACATTVMK